MARQRVTGEVVRALVDLLHERDLGVHQPAGPQDAVHLGHDPRRVGDVLQDRLADDRVERGVGEREVVRVADERGARAERDVGLDAGRGPGRRVSCSKPSPATEPPDDQDAAAAAAGVRPRAAARAGGARFARATRLCDSDGSIRRTRASRRAGLRTAPDRPRGP